MVKESGLLDLLPAGKRVLGDGGFKGDPRIVTPFTRAQAAADPRKRAFNRRVAHHRWRIEATFRRLKNFHALKLRFRHPPSKHKLLWALAVYVHNLDVVRHPLCA